MCYLACKIFRSCIADSTACLKIKHCLRKHYQDLLKHLEGRKQQALQQFLCPIRLVTIDNGRCQYPNSSSQTYTALKFTVSKEASRHAGRPPLASKQHSINDLIMIRHIFGVQLISALHEELSPDENSAAITGQNSAERRNSYFEIGAVT